MKKLSVYTAVISGVLQLLGYLIYDWAIFSGDIKPNASSWFLWAFGSGIATWSYLKLSQDLIKTILPLVCSVACVVTFFFALFNGSFSVPDRYDMFILLMTLGIIVFYSFTKERGYTNLLIQIETVFSFIPIIKGAHLNPEGEEVLPWLVWSFAYLLMGLTVLMRYEKWWDLMYPVNYFILCGVTVLVILI